MIVQPATSLAGDTAIGEAADGQPTATLDSAQRATSDSALGRATRPSPVVGAHVANADSIGVNARA